jgi:hypothetical protein
MRNPVIYFALVGCIVGPSLARPQPQELTLKDFAADVRPNGARSLGEESFAGVLISPSYREVRRQGRKGESNRIKFPTLTVQNPNTLSIGSPIQKVANENGPVFNNNLSTKDIETKIEEINKKEEEKKFNQNRAEQITKDIELLAEVSLLEDIVELEKEVNEELIELEVAEELIELAPEIAQSDVLYSDEESVADISDFLYRDDASEEVDIPVIVEEEIIELPAEFLSKLENLPGLPDNFEISSIENLPSLVDMIDIKIPSLAGVKAEDPFLGLSKILSEGSGQAVENADTNIDIETDTSVPNIDFGQIQEV